MDYKDRYQQWLDSAVIDEQSKEELRTLERDGQDAELQDRFYRDLEFGTGGLRGKIGVGTNRMNVYTVRKATQGLANYLLERYGQAGQQIAVAIGFDSRHFSPEFAQDAALCLAANGIKAYIFPSLRPTPMLSFAVRHLHCKAGIVVTASHNPAIYNGYKVYGEDGAQITFPVDKDIIACVNKVTDLATVKTMKQEQAEAQGLYEQISPELDRAYYEAVKSQIINPELLKETAGDLKIVYTPLHGTGNIPVRTVLKELGFTQVKVVTEQEQPDGAFPTVRSPNPEDPKAFELALKLAQAEQADLVLATDPDADRIGVYAKNSKGEYQSFTGNMSGMLMLYYICSQKQALQQLPANGTVVSTIVSGKMSRKICDDFKLQLILTLTGFKYIGEQIKFFEQEPQPAKHSFVFGYEESYGALIGTHARDKDAVVSAMMLCEVAAYCKHEGMSLCDLMEQIFKRYGYYQEALQTLTLDGQDGARQINAMMERIREQIPTQVGDYKVVEFKDFKQDRAVDLLTGAEGKTGLPNSNVLYFTLERDAWFCIRPSGTEPKIKLYMGVCADSMDKAQQELQSLGRELEQLLQP
ncbi:MAG TPA: phospho-sugar mutase [Candidatus Anaerobiospirillum pullistercoris]|uniref:Phospho-sugar mutase n=1 Tax=Candidatus Anaerobiospirillum pullistercoris TaxID=2838452 RepID=A0A9D1WCJ0_9GAMM|nr:phospho-sugar mutase [Candidatus Anaerobiospirillum pullistercoris]